jgi:gluconolactonase
MLDSYEAIGLPTKDKLQTRWCGVAYCSLPSDAATRKPSTFPATCHEDVTAAPTAEHPSCHHCGYSDRLVAMHGTYFAIVIPCLTILLSLSPLAAQDAGIVAPGAKLELLADGFDFTEGPASDSEGNVYFTDQPNNKILKWSVDGKLSTFHEEPGRSNGLYFGNDGNLYACADLENELWMIEPAGVARVLVTDYQGKKLNGPNDLWIDPKGGIYFTDPFYKRDYWARGDMEQDGQHVYYLSPDRKKLTRVTDNLEQPNGIIGSPDGKQLYVADIRARKTYVYTINPDATLGDRKLAADSGSDGVSLDNQGNLYLSGKGITVYNPAGEQIDHIDVPERWTANVTFGGADQSTLFITAMDSLYSIQTKVRGAGH